MVSVVDLRYMLEDYCLSACVSFPTFVSSTVWYSHIVCSTQDGIFSNTKTIQRSFILVWYVSMSNLLNLSTAQHHISRVSPIQVRGLPLNVLLSYYAPGGCMEEVVVPLSAQRPQAAALTHRALDNIRDHGRRRVDRLHLQALTIIYTASVAMRSKH